jgi:TRAP-type mannitol/chloroaromatic compound transport system substrate-binding protein
MNSSRRRLLGASAAGALAGFPVIAQAQAETRWRWQGAWSAKDIFHEYALDYAKTVRELSGGRLRIEVLPAGAVVKPPDLITAVHKGVLDGSHAVPAFWQGLNPAFSLFGSGPAFGMDANNFLAWMAYGGGRDLYEELLRGAMNLNVTGFLYGPMPTQPLGWFRKPVESAAQLKGLRIATAGLALELFREMGAAAEALPPEERAQALAGGRLDGAESSNPTSDRWLGLPDAAKICMLRSYHQPAEAFEILVNRARFEALPDDLRAIVSRAADAAGSDLSWKALHRYSQDYEWLQREKGVEFRRTPPDVLRAQMQAWSALAKRISRESPIGEKVIKSQLAWARRTVGWTREATVDPRLAYDHWFAKKTGRERN